MQGRFISNKKGFFYSVHYICSFLTCTLRIIVLFYVENISGNTSLQFFGRQKTYYFNENTEGLPWSFLNYHENFHWKVHQIFFQIDAKKKKNKTKKLDANFIMILRLGVKGLIKITANIMPY